MISRPEVRASLPGPKAKVLSLSVSSWLSPSGPISTSPPSAAISGRASTSGPAIVVE